MSSKIFQWFCQAITNTNSIKHYLHPLIRLIYQDNGPSQYNAKVCDLREENTNTFTATLKPSSRWPGFKAGQFIQIMTQINGSFVSRVFSISSSPQIHQSSGMIELTIQIQNDGKVTPHLLTHLVENPKVSISQAQGDFTVNERSQRPLLMIAAGSGITPIRSLITELMSSDNFKHNVQLLYYARNNDHLFREELEYYQEKHPYFTAQFINSNTHGRINLDHLREFCHDYQSRSIYLCGPASMIEDTTTLLTDNGVDSAVIHHEYFGAPPIYDIGINQQGTIDFLRSSVKVTTTKNQTLLSAAESSGLTPQHGCRMGVCHQCVCHKKQGVVYNTISKTFSDNTSEEIQLCVSLPVGDVTLYL